MKTLRILGLFVSLAFCAAVLTGCTHVTGGGVHVGNIIQLSDDGLFVKTHEIEVVRGGMNGGSGSFSTKPFYGTINDPGLLAKAQDAFDKQYEVKVTYTTYFFTPLASDNGDTFVTDIEPANPPK